MDVFRGKKRVIEATVAKASLGPKHWRDEFARCLKDKHLGNE
jgi:hypothetical protein